MFDNRKDILLFGYNLGDYSSFSWLLVKEIKLKLKPCFYNILILYILEAFFFNS